MDLTGVILLTGIGIVIGFLVAALIFSQRRGSAPEKQPKQQVLSDSENNLRVWREAGEKRLVVELNGASYRQGNKMHPEQRRILESLVIELHAWLGAASSPLNTEDSQPAFRQEPVSERSDEPQDETSLNPLKIFGDALQPRKKTESEDLDQSIVGQIDQILQTKLEETDLEDRGIRLVEGPDQGMVIEVGLQKYTEIDAVPDEQVRQLIRQSVADWEVSLEG
jgi:hypothetical protein